MSKTPICMAEEYWVNSPLSIARYYGHVRISGQEYIIVDKQGRDLWEASAAKDRRGSDKAIPPGEPADLLRKDFQRYYKKLGREEFLSVLKAYPHASADTLKNIYKEKCKAKKERAGKT